MAETTAPEYFVYARRSLADGRVAEVIPLTFGRARRCIGPADRPFYEDGW